jgi:hypothetical protein
MSRPVMSLLAAKVVERIICKIAFQVLIAMFRILLVRLVLYIHHAAGTDVMKYVVNRSRNSFALKLSPQPPVIEGIVVLLIKVTIFSEESFSSKETLIASGFGTKKDSSMKV